MIALPGHQLSLASVQNGTIVNDWSQVVDYYVAGQGPYFKFSHTYKVTPIFRGVKIVSRLLDILAYFQQLSCSPYTLYTAQFQFTIIH